MIDIFEEYITIKLVYLVGLNHPNLLKYFYAIKDCTNKISESFVIENNIHKLYLIKKLMEMDLYVILEIKNHHIIHIDIIYQIEKEMCYLHNM